MRILGLIPARGGSKGVPRKNIKILGGKELIRYSIEVGLQCKSIDKLIVSTDDEEIAEVSRAAGAEVPFLRPEALASDQSPTIDVILHALSYFRQQGVFFDALCLLQPTTPFRSLEDLNEAISVFSHGKADCLTSVREVPAIFNPHWVFEIHPETGFLNLATGEDQLITRRQDLPKAYYRDGAIYITKSDVLLEQNSIYGKSILPFQMKSSPDINIDGPEDWKKAEDYLLPSSNGDE